MAINLKSFGVRSLTAVVFVAVLATGILWSYLTFTVLFLFVGLVALKEFFLIAEKMQARPYRLSGYVCGLIIYAAFSYRLLAPGYPHQDKMMMALLTLPFFIFARSLFSKRETPLLNAVYTISALVYALLPFALLHYLVLAPGPEGSLRYAPEKLIAVILLIWCNDTFAYIGGSLYGKHKMMERVSPGKTWEGTLTGILLSVGAAFLLRNYLLQEEGWLWPALGILIPVLATCGDLVESLLKRQAGLKDSGNILPGHGGVLDRFDSLIFVSPFVVVILQWL